MIKEQNRVIEDVNGEYLCQMRIVYDGEKYGNWQTAKICESKEEAEKYFDDVPDWVNIFQTERI